MHHLRRMEGTAIITEVIKNSKSDAHLLQDFDYREHVIFKPEMMMAEGLKTPIELL